MLSIGIRELMRGLVPQLLRDGMINHAGSQERVLHVKFDLQMSYHGCINNGGKSYSARRGLYLLYHTLTSSVKYITVWSAVADTPFVKAKEIPTWNFEARHDEFWRDVAVFSDTYFKMADQINAEMKRDGYPKVAPAAMLETHTTPIFDNLYEWLSAKITKDLTDDKNYRHNVKLL